MQGADLAHHLTHAPPECLAETSTQTEIGRALFRSPSLLGGPAARLGLSCNACHAGGRANARFFLPELTDRAGAADVTAEWASAVRGDGIMNPIPIPDLTGVAARAAFGRSREPSLARFVAAVIEEEFQGEAPPPEAFDGLIAYLTALDPAHCPTRAEEPRTLKSAADDVRRPLAAARRTEDATARLMLLAAQEALGRIAERLPEARFAAERRSLEGLARELGALRASAGLPALSWMARFDGLIAALEARRNETYFNEAALAAAIRPALP